MPHSPFPNLKFSHWSRHKAWDLQISLSLVLRYSNHCENAEDLQFKITYYFLVVIDTLAEISLLSQKEASLEWLNTELCKCGLIKG